MSKYWIIFFITPFFIIIVSLILIIFSVRNRSDFESYQQRYENLNGSLEYAYTPKHNNLNIIILHLKNPGLENNDTYKLSILSGGSTIISQNFTGFNIGDPTDLRFQFDPITDSGNKNLILRLDTQFKQDNPILVGVDNNGNLAFSSYYKTTNKYNEFKDVIKSLLIHIGKDPLFFVSMFMFSILIFWKWKNIR